MWLQSYPFPQMFYCISHSLFVQTKLTSHFLQHLLSGRFHHLQWHIVSGNTKHCALFKILQFFYSMTRLCISVLVRLTPVLWISNATDNYRSGYPRQGPWYTCFSPLTYFFLSFSHRCEEYGPANRHPVPSHNANYCSAQGDGPPLRIPHTNSRRTPFLHTCSLGLIYNILAGWW